MWNLHEPTGLPQDDQNVIFHMIFYLFGYDQGLNLWFDEWMGSGCVYGLQMKYFGPCKPNSSIKNLLGPTGLPQKDQNSEISHV